MNFFLYLLLVGVNFLMALSRRIPANPHKNVILETTLPKDKLQDEQVLAVSRTYKKRLLQGAFIFTILALPILIIPYDSLTLIYFIVNVFSFIGAFYYLEILSIRKMTAVKVKNNWVLPVRPILVDTKLVANKNRKLISILVVFTQPFNRSFGLYLFIRNTWSNRWDLAFLSACCSYDGDVLAFLLFYCTFSSQGCDK